VRLSVPRLLFMPADIGSLHPKLAGQLRSRLDGRGGSGFRCKIFLAACQERKKGAESRLSD
jgi:hypothetical protein